MPYKNIKLKYQQEILRSAQYSTRLQSDGQLTKKCIITTTILHDGLEVTVIC